MLAQEAMAMVPPHTHDWRLYVKPHELGFLLQACTRPARTPHAPRTRPARALHVRTVHVPYIPRSLRTICIHLAHISHTSRTSSAS